MQCMLQLSILCCSSNGDQSVDYVCVCVNMNLQPPLPTFSPLSLSSSSLRYSMFARLMSGRSAAGGWGAPI